MSVIYNKTKKCEYSLSNSDIYAVAAETENCLRSMKYEPKNITSVRLSLEEYLLRWQSKFGADAKFVFAIGKRYRRTYLPPELRGEQFNPIESDDEQMDWSNRILSNLGLRPSYSYSRSTNQVRLELVSHKNNTFSGFWLQLQFRQTNAEWSTGTFFLPAERNKQIKNNAIITSTIFFKNAVS